MKARRIGFGLLATFAMLATAACGGGSDAGDGGGDDKYSIGIVKFASTDETSEAVIQTFRDYADSQGWETTAVDPQGAVDKANGAMQDFVQKKVDLIVTAVFDSGTLTSGARSATAAGIPVVTIASGTAPGITYNLDSGVTIGEPVAKQLVEDMGGEGDLLLLGYKSGLPCIGREKALTDALEGTDITVTREEVPIPGQLDASTRFSQAWLAKHPKGSGKLAIWGCFDDPALGAVAAVKGLDRDDVLIYGINGQPAAINAIEAGTMRATVWQDINQAGTEFAKLVPEMIEAGTDAAPKDIPIVNELVTTDNVADFLKNHPDAG